MNNHLMKRHSPDLLNGPSIGVNASRSFVIDLSHAVESRPHQSYLVTLQQSNGTTQTLQLTENEVEALGLQTCFLSANNENVNTATDGLKSLPTAKQNVKEDLEQPLGSPENPIQIIQSGNTLCTTHNLSKTHLQLIANALVADGKKQAENKVEEVSSNNFVYRVVYPEEFNLKPLLSKQEKRGRPKKRPVVSGDEEVKVAEIKPVKNARTRSGRITRPPRHIEKDFKKIEIGDYDENEEDVTTTEFTPLTTSQKGDEEPQLVEPLSNNPKKRNISSKYRCPKCQKAYLGRSRMLRHLQDYPDHGPIPEHCKDNNFEMWNFLVDITQKCPTGTRGKKFCAELTNLLQNLKVLTRFLFKLSGDKNSVKVNKLLANALNMIPGDYKFNENELHKDITVFKLLEETKFFEDSYLNNGSSSNANNTEIVSNISTTENFITGTNNFNGTEKSKLHNSPFLNGCFESNGAVSKNNLAVISENANSLLQQKIPASINESIGNPVNLALSANSFLNMDANHHDINMDLNDFSSTNNLIHRKTESETDKKQLNHVDNTICLHSDLLSDNSLLNSLPNLRGSVDDLIMGSVDTSHVSHLLENSTSSDEVMNVDQFVNERLKNITGPDMDLPNSSLSLDLPSLDLFNFHHS